MGRMNRCSVRQGRMVSLVQSSFVLLGKLAVLLRVARMLLAKVSGTLISIAVSSGPALVRVVRVPMGTLPMTAVASSAMAARATGILGKRVFCDSIHSLTHLVVVVFILHAIVVVEVLGRLIHLMHRVVRGQELCLRGHLREGIGVLLCLL